MTVRSRSSSTQGVARRAGRRPRPDRTAVLLIGDSERHADLYYATRFLAPDPFVFVALPGERVLITSDLEVDRARQQARVDQVVSVRELLARSRRADLAGVAAAWLADRGVRRVEVPSAFPFGYAASLRALGVHVAVRPDPFWPERALKDDDEVRHIEDALRHTEAALAAAVAMVRAATIGADGVLRHEGAPLTSERLRRVVEVKLMEAGCVAQHTIIAGGDQGCDPHQVGSGPLRAHETIVMDIFPQSSHSRYYADLTRTVVKGRASPRVKAMYQAVREGQDLACAAIRDGADGRRIHERLIERFRKQGFDTGCVNGHMQGFFHGTGHGVGLEIHEAPRISPGGSRLRARQVVTVEPGLYYPGVGGVRLEDVVVVTERGCRNLTRAPRQLEVA